MIERNLSRSLRDIAGLYPVVTVTGPRQSGKTTLCRATFPDKPLVSLEPLDVREYARTDPRGFLAEHGAGAILDEIQHVPELTSYLQVEVDTRPEPGRFILTGSENLSLSAAVSQSLAGRTAVLHLLCPSLDELRRFDGAPTDLLTTLWTGAYPRILDRGIPADRWLADYVTTYVQRDVRQILNIGDLNTFTAFLRLAAGRTGRELNLSGLAGDVGISHHTARAWISALEASFLCVRVPAWHKNLDKRVVKAPKLHFLDSGLVCHLLGIREPEQLRAHPLRGAVFESWVAAELYKHQCHHGAPVRMFHFRESNGLEVDLVIESAAELRLVEAKSSATITPDFFAGLTKLAERVARTDPQPVAPFVVFGGEEGQRRSIARALPWHQIHDIDW